MSDPLVYVHRSVIEDRDALRAERDDLYGDVSRLGARGDRLDDECNRLQAERDAAIRKAAWERDNAQTHIQRLVEERDAAVARAAALEGALIEALRALRAVIGDMTLDEAAP